MQSTSSGQVYAGGKTKRRESPVKNGNEKLSYVLFGNHFAQSS
jgi:hypothetical protein